MGAVLALSHLPLTWDTWHTVGANVEAARVIMGVTLVGEFLMFLAAIAALVFVQRLGRLQQRRIDNAA